MDPDRRRHLFEGQEVSFSYEKNPKDGLALNHLEFFISEGEIVCLSGPSGSGKSTLLNLMALIERPQHGTFSYRGKNVAELSEAEICHIRRFEIGFIFQDFQLIEVLSVEENVEYFAHRQKVPFEERKTRVKEALDSVGMLAYAKRRVTDLSGGQRQRVAIARALAKKPSLIIADEPTANLDLATGRQVLETMQRLHREQNITMIIASHDLTVLEYCHRILHIQDGKIATTKEVKGRAS